jgi:hypothetical protein
VKFLFYILILKKAGKDLCRIRYRLSEFFYLLFEIGIVEYLVDSIAKGMGHLGEVIRCSMDAVLGQMN